MQAIVKTVAILSIAASRYQDPANIRKNDYKKNNNSN